MAGFLEGLKKVFGGMADEIGWDFIKNFVLKPGWAKFTEAREQLQKTLRAARPWIQRQVFDDVLCESNGERLVDINGTVIHDRDHGDPGRLVRELMVPFDKDIGDPLHGGFYQNEGEEVLNASIQECRGESGEIPGQLLELYKSRSTLAESRVSDAREARKATQATYDSANKSYKEAHDKLELAEERLRRARQRLESGAINERRYDRFVDAYEEADRKLGAITLVRADAERRLESTVARIESAANQAVDSYQEVVNLLRGYTPGDKAARDLLRVVHRAVLLDKKNKDLGQTHLLRVLRALDNDDNETFLIGLWRKIKRINKKELFNSLAELLAPQLEAVDAVFGEVLVDTAHALRRARLGRERSRDEAHPIWSPTWRVVKRLLLIP